MADGNRLYPVIEPHELDSSSDSAAVASPRVPKAEDAPDSSQGAGLSLNEDAHNEDTSFPVNDAGFGLDEEQREDTTAPVYDEFSSLQREEDINSPAVYDEFSSLQLSWAEESKTYMAESSTDRTQGRYFYYDSPHYEETGIWIPVSVPPLSESDHKEWSRGFSSNGAFFPEGEISWDEFAGEDKEMTLWDVFSEMLFAAQGKVSSLSIGEFRRGSVSFISTHLLEQAWKEMATTLTDANIGNAKELLDMEPPRWLLDSASSSCMLCSVRFHPFMCSRHHCRFCGGLFCGQCSRGRSLLPPKFRLADPQRVCDVCCVRLESVQPYLMDQVSRASQLPTHDLTDLSTLRSWLNFPWGQSMEYEIYKAANIIRGYNKVGSLRPEKSIPDALLKQAKGLAILTVAKVGLMVTYNVGTGLVVARRDDGSWSPPSAISSFGLGWGAQAGGEFTDFIIVLRTKDAIKTFGGNAHISVGAGVSAAAGIVGRAAEADFRAGDGGYAACYTYSCSKGGEMETEDWYFRTSLIKKCDKKDSTRYDPRKRISAAQALEHEYFRIDPLPGRNALVPSQPGEKVVHYPARPVDTTTDFEGTTSVQPQQLSGNAVSGIVAGASMVSSRSVPRPMMVAMNRMTNPGMAFNMASQAGMGGVNPGGIPMQRGNAAQAHQQQLRRKDQGMGMQPGYPQQKRRF